MMRFHLRLATLIAVLAFAEGCSNFVLGVIQSFGTPGGAKISTIAGNGTAGFSGDNGQAPAAELSQPYDVALDASGNQYIADTNNSRIRMVNTNGIITTVASGFFNPQAVVAYGTNFLYVADSGNQVSDDHERSAFSSVSRRNRNSRRHQSCNATACKFCRPELPFRPRGQFER